MEELNKADDAKGAETPDNPVARLQKRADDMATTAAVLKKIADAADPLYKTLDEGQKRRLTILAHMEHRFGGGEGWRHRGMDRGGDRDRDGGDRDRGYDRDGGRDHGGRGGPERL